MSSKITEAEWAAAKPDIKYLYLTLHKSLKEVKEEMNQRNFQATESQYRTQFKKWGQKWAKNRKTEEMEMLSVLIEGRKLNGKESNVFEWGKLLKKEEVKKRTARSNPNTLRRLELENKQLLPRQFVVRTPTEDRTSLFTLDLPFFQLEKSICNGTLVSGILSNTGVNARLLTDQITVPENPLAIRQRSIEYAFKHIKLLDKPWRDPFLNTETAILNALSSIIPCHIHQTTVLGPPLYRQLLHSAGNNFAGLGSFPATQILQILNETTSVDLYALVLSPLGHSSLYSARSMAQSLLESAIHAGHSTTVKAILSSKSLAIDVNQQFILGYRRYTLIEMASLLGHDCIIKILLYHDADVDKTYPCEDCTAGIPNLFGCTSHGALQCLLGYGSSKKHGETVQMLLNATSYVNMKTLALLIRRGYGDIASGVTVEYSLGCREDVIPHLREVFELQEESTLAGMLHLLHSRGIDVTHNDIFVAAVMKKSWKLVEVLLSYGLVLNKALLHYLFESRLGFGQSSLDRIKPCFPILPRFPSLPVEVEMVQEEPGSSRCIFTNRIPPAELDALCVKWMAAVDEVDTKLIEELTSELRNLNIPIVTFRFFYHALMEVSRMGDYETASILLCRIANLDLPIGHRVFQDALSEAIRGGNNNLVQLFLAFDVNPSYMTTDYHSIDATAYLLQPYTKLEFLYPLDTVLRSHIFESEQRKPDTVLFLAATPGNEEIVRSMLAARGCIDISEAIRYNHVLLTSLLLEQNPFQITEVNFEDSVNHRNLDMAKLLIYYGADPHGSCEILQKAQATYRPIFELLLKAHNETRKVKGGVSIPCALSNAIDNGDEHDIKYLLDHSVDPNIFISRGRCIRPDHRPWHFNIGEVMSPFGEAIGTGRLKLVEPFLKAGCDPNSVVARIYTENSRLFGFPQTTTGFVAAVSTRNAEMVKLFIRNGAIINPAIVGFARRTPLQRAAEIGCFEMVELLHNFGADINTLPAVRGGATALQLAAIGGYNRIVCYLLNHKAEVDAPAAVYEGMTALEGAAFNGRTDTVHILLRAGAASHGKDRSQLEKAMKMARKNGHFPTADLIQDWPDLLDDESLGMLDIRDDIGEDMMNELINWDGES